MVIVDASLHHPGPGLTLLGRTPLVRHSRGLELNYNLLEAKKTQTMSDPCVVATQVFELKVEHFTASHHVIGFSFPTRRYLWVMHDDSLPGRELQPAVPLVGRYCFLILCLRPPEINMNQ